MSRQIKDNGLDLGITTATIKLYTVDNKDSIKALAALCGGYNQHARKVDLAKYEAVRAKFDEAISEMEELLA